MQATTSQFLDLGGPSASTGNSNKHLYILHIICTPSNTHSTCWRFFFALFSLQAKTNQFLDLGGPSANTGSSNKQQQQAKPADNR
jgi:hypothetical protein